MRFLADIPPEDVKWLDHVAQEQGRSRAAVLRDAVSAYRSNAGHDWLDRGFGLWKGRAEIDDAVEWQRRERAGSTRPWDADYEEVRAEFPNLFDAEDDRQRAIYLASRAGQDRANAPRPA